MPNVDLHIAKTAEVVFLGYVAVWDDNRLKTNTAKRGTNSEMNLVCVIAANGGILSKADNLSLWFIFRCERLVGNKQPLAQCLDNFISPRNCSCVVPNGGRSLLYYILYFHYCMIYSLWTEPAQPCYLSHSSPDPNLISHRCQLLSLPCGSSPTTCVLLTPSCYMRLLAACEVLSLQHLQLPGSLQT